MTTKFKKGDEVVFVGNINLKGLFGIVLNPNDQGETAVSFYNWNNGHNFRGENYEITDRSGWYCLDQHLEHATKLHKALS